jgi:hypothetical protein
MSIGTARAGDVGSVPGTGPGRDPLWVLGVYQAGASGSAVLREAGERLAAGAELMVVTLAPQATPLRCCRGGGTGPYNCAVREIALEELHQARALLGSLAGRAQFRTLVGTPEPPLADWAAAQSFDVILLARRRLALRGGRLVRQLRRATSAEVLPVG